jgi:hypothetical protein
MIKLITLNINGEDREIEIPFGYIPVYDGPIYVGDKSYRIYDEEFVELDFAETRYDEVRDYYLVIRPVLQNEIDDLSEYNKQLDRACGRG